MGELVIPLRVRTFDPQLSMIRTRTRTGGKDPAPHIQKPVKTKSKRADVLRYFLRNKAARDLPTAAIDLGVSRQNLLSYWAAIHREHGIGYAIKDGALRPILPPGATPANIFGG